MTKTKVFWTEEERQAVYKEVVRLKSSVDNMKWPPASLLELVRQAQLKILPKHRHKVIRTSTNVREIQAMLDNKPSTVKITSPREELPVIDLPEIKESINLRQELVDLLVTVGTDIIKDVVAGIKKNLTQEFNGQVNIVTEKVKAPLMKIAVYGLLPTQTHSIRDQFKGCFEFRFLKDVNQAQLLSAVKWADKFILMTKFISHDYGAIRKYSNISYINGGVSDLCNELTRIYVAGEST